jgi:hypothetical protein
MLAAHFQQNERLTVSPAAAQDRKHTSMISVNLEADNLRRAGRREGHRRKDAAHAILDARRERFVTQARRQLLFVLLEQGTASADDVRERITLPADIGPVCLGAVPKPLALAGIIRRIGYTVTSRPVAHARPVSIWELVDPDAARRWLADHPEPSPIITPTDSPGVTEAAPDVANFPSVQRTLFDAGGDSR